MQLYEFGPTRSIRARWVLQELGLDFESVTVNLKAGEHRRPEFLKLNPAGKLPVLVDGDVVLTESVAIVLYLAEKYGDGLLWPTSLEERAQVTRWLLFIATELEQPLWRIARHTALYPEHLRLLADIPLAKQDFCEMAAVLDAHMEGRKFLVGESLTATDIVGAYTLDWANEASLLEPFPRLGEYMERMYSRPAAAPRIAEAFAAIANACSLDHPLRGRSTKPDPTGPSFHSAGAIETDPHFTEATVTVHTQNLEKLNMSTAKVKPIPEGMHSVTPHLICAGAADAIEFYKKAFDAVELSRMPGPDGQIMHAAIHIGDSVIMLADEMPGCGGLGPLSLNGSPVTIHLYVDDADAFAERAVRAGATLTMPVEDMFWGDRYGQVKDPFGHQWAVATHTCDLTPDQIRQAFEKFREARVERGAS